MSKIIELIDSDDETNIVTSTTSLDIKPNIATNDILPATNETQAPSSTTPLNTSNSSSDQSGTSPTIKRARQRARKTQHQTLRLSPDMQFETIALDDDDDEEPPNKKCASLSEPTKSLEPTLSKNLIEAALWGPASEQFLNDPQIILKLQQIAEERIRLNFLLNAYHMPNINFGLYSSFETLKLQFVERIKQLKERTTKSKTNKTISAQTATTSTQKKSDGSENEADKYANN